MHGSSLPIERPRVLVSSWGREPRPMARNRSNRVDREPRHGKAQQTNHQTLMRGRSVVSDTRPVLRMFARDGIATPSEKFCRCPNSDSKKPRTTCENWTVRKGTVPVVANGGIGDTTGTVPFARKAPHSSLFSRAGGLKLC